MSVVLLRFDEVSGLPSICLLFYTYSMKRILAIAAVLVFLLLSSSHLYAAEKQYAHGQIITVEKKFHERVLYYQGNTPIIAG